MLTEDKCEHGNYHCYICEVELLRFTIDELQQQNKQLIEALQGVVDAQHVTEGCACSDCSAYRRAAAALQQIQGNK